MTDRVAMESEIKSLIGEAIGSLELVAHSANALNRRGVLDALSEAFLKIQRAQLLADRLP